MSQVIQSRVCWSVCLSIPVGVAGALHWPFPEENAVLQLILLEKPMLFYVLKYAYLTMLFSTPFIAFSVTLSSLYIFLAQRKKQTGFIRLPKYPEEENRDQPYSL
jgi:hypothetical protein